MKGKRSTFLKGLKRRYSKTPRHTKMAPNSTKVGQGEGNVDRNFDVAERRATQESKKSKPNGSKSRYAVMLEKREAERAKSKKGKKKEVANG